MGHRQKGELVYTHVTQKLLGVTKMRKKEGMGVEGKGQAWKETERNHISLREINECGNTRNHTTVSV